MNVNTIEDLKALIESGQFHHATLRHGGTLMEGWHIYAKEDNGFNGFVHVGSFIDKVGSEMERAVHALVRSTGYSVGCYGGG